MAAGYNTNFHREDSFSSVMHRHDISFQSGAVNSTSEVISSGYYHRMNASNGNLMYCDSFNTISCSSPSTTTASNSSSSLLLDSVPGLNHDASLAVEWTEEEQFKLEGGLVKYKDEPSIMKYIKIAALLRDKTVRDVALRCRWMTRKRKKQEEYHSGKKGNYRKDKFVESSLPPNFPSTSMPSMNMTPYSHQSSQMDQKQHVNYKVLTSKAKQLLEQNVQTLNLINSNLSLYKLQDNIDLFCRARDNINNINAMINDMRELSGKIGQICKSFHYVLIKISHKSFATYKFGGSYSCGLLRIGWQFYPGTNSYLQVSYYETDCHIRFSIPLVMCCPRSFILL